MSGHNLRVGLLLLAISGSGADQAMAQAGEDLSLLYGDEESVSIATGAIKPIRLAPSVASVLTADEINNSGATTLDEILTQVPGLYVGISPFNRLNPNWSIRGISTDQTPQVLLLRDGVPISHFYNGARPNLFHLPLAGVERIEVIRGPGSAIYGADAYAGVINVITRTATALAGSQAGGRVGSFDRRDAWLQHGNRLGDWNLGLNFEFAHADGDKNRRIDSDLQKILDPIFGTNASQAPGALSTGYDVLNATLRLDHGPWDISLWHWRLMAAGVGAGAAQALDPGGRQDTDLSQIDVHYRTRHDETWNSDVRFNYRALNDRPKFVLFPAGAILPIGSDGNIDMTSSNLVTFTDGVLGQPAVFDRFAELAWTTLFGGWTDHQWRIGVGVKLEDERAEEKKNFGPGVIDGSISPVDGSLTDVTGTANIFLPDNQRTVKYLSLQDEWQFAPDWQLTAGLRYDHYSDFGATLNPRLALVWSTRHDLTSKFMYGRAFRAPSFGEMHARNNPVVLGNANLKPETIDSWELAFDHRPRPGLTNRINLFRYQVKDLIDYVAAGGVSTAQNVQDRDGHGLELETEWKVLPMLRVEASYAWQHSQDAHTGQAVANTPGQMAALRATWQASPHWTLALQSQWLADFKRAAGDGRAPLDDYALTQLTLRHPLADKRFELAASVSNLFDQDARAPSLANSGITQDYPLPGRAMWLELRYRDR